MKQGTTVIVEDFAVAHRRLVESGLHPLKVARNLYHLTQHGLAEEVRVGRTTIAQAEAGGPIGPVTRERLATYFGMDVCPFTLKHHLHSMQNQMHRDAATSPETISPQAIAALMQHFGTLLQFLRLRSHVMQCDVLAMLVLYSDEVSQEQYSRLETGSPPRFCHLVPIYKALVRSGVEIQSEEREAYLLLAQKHIGSKKTQHEHVAAERWQILSDELTAFDAGEPDAAYCISKNEVPV